MRARTWTVFLVVGVALGIAAALLGPTAQAFVALPLGIAASTCRVSSPPAATPARSATPGRSSGWPPPAS